MDILRQFRHESLFTYPNLRRLAVFLCKNLTIGYTSKVLRSFFRSFNLHLFGYFLLNLVFSHFVCCLPVTPFYLFRFSIKKPFLIEPSILLQITLKGSFQKEKSTVFTPLIFRRSTVEEVSVGVAISLDKRNLVPKGSLRV